MTLLGEERPRPMGFWLSLLVIALHLSLLQQLLKPLEPLTKAKPLMMEVALMSAAAPKEAETVVKPVAAVQPPPPKKTPKAIKKKPKPVVKKPIEQPKKVVTRAEKIPKQREEPEESVEEAPVAPPAPAKAVVPKVAAAPKKAEVYTEANFQANYGYNPKPVYPGIARRNHWEGQVLLRVRVSADGSAEGVNVQRSSGHEELDDAAVEAVRRWRFIPAKRGTTPVSSSVLVPINFNLRN